MPRKPKSEVQRIIDYKQTFGGETGKRVLHDLMVRCHMLSPTFDSKNPNETNFREGERNVVLMILHTLGVDTYRLEESINEIEAQKQEDYV